VGLDLDLHKGHRVLDLAHLHRRPQHHLAPVVQGQLDRLLVGQPAVHLLVAVLAQPGLEFVVEGHDELGTHVLLADCAEVGVVGSSRDGVKRIKHCLTLLVEIVEDVELVESDGAGPVLVVVEVVADVDAGNFVVTVQINLNKGVVTML